MRSLLNVTVLISSVLSIFSTTLALYDMPEIKEKVAAVENGERISRANTQSEMKRIYISHDASEDKASILEIATINKSLSSENKNDHINVFGVSVPDKTGDSKI
ncbi:MAG: hypothetical protein AAF462_03395 [Thermodesulfobacteriota bacterium]